jgi:Acetyltransferase (GNAT) domain
MSALHENEVYRSIFMDRGWITERFQGWRSWHEGERVRALVKPGWPLTRHLILSYGTLDEVDRLVQSHSPWAMGSRVTLKWFSQPWEHAPLHISVGGRRMQLVDGSARTLNKYTFVFDLHGSEEQLWSGFNQATRRKCKGAERAQASLQTIQDPASPKVETFVQKLAAVSLERGLQMPDPAMLRNLLACGAAALHVATESGQDITMVMLYRAGDTVYYLYGVTLDEQSQGGGHWIHWECLRHYKELGLRWYDFGGVSSMSDDNGIYRFKRGFGGRAVDLGAEYCWQGALVHVAQRVRHRMQEARAEA